MSEVKTETATLSVEMPYDEGFDTESEKLQIDAPEDRTIHSITVSAAFNNQFMSLFDVDDVAQLQQQAMIWLGGTRPVDWLDELRFRGANVENDTRVVGEYVDRFFISREPDQSGGFDFDTEQELVADMETFEWKAGQTLNVQSKLTGFQDVIDATPPDADIVALRVTIRYTEGGGLR